MFPCALRLGSLSAPACHDTLHGVVVVELAALRQQGVEVVRDEAAPAAPDPPPPEDVWSWRRPPSSSSVSRSPAPDYARSSPSRSRSRASGRVPAAPSPGRPAGSPKVRRRPAPEHLDLGLPAVAGLRPLPHQLLQLTAPCTASPPAWPRLAAGSSAVVAGAAVAGSCPTTVPLLRAQMHRQARLGHPQPLLPARLPLLGPLPSPSRRVSRPLTALTSPPPSAAGS